MIELKLDNQRFSWYARFAKSTEFVGRCLITVIYELSVKMRIEGLTGNSVANRSIGLRELLPIKISHQIKFFSHQKSASLNGMIRCIIFSLQH